MKQVDVAGKSWRARIAVQGRSARYVAFGVSVLAEKSKYFFLDCSVGHNFAPSRNPLRPPWTWRAEAMLGKDSAVTSIAVGQFQKQMARRRGVATIFCARTSRSVIESSASAGVGARRLGALLAACITWRRCEPSVAPSIRQPASRRRVRAAKGRDLNDTGIPTVVSEPNRPNRPRGDGPFDIHPIVRLDGLSESARPAERLEVQIPGLSNRNKNASDSMPGKVRPGVAWRKFGWPRGSGILPPRPFNART